MDIQEIESWKWLTGLITTGLSALGVKRIRTVYIKKKQKRIDTSQNKRIDNMEEELKVFKEEVKTDLKKMSSRIEANGKADEERNTIITAALGRIEDNQADMKSEFVKVRDKVDSNWEDYMKDRVDDQKAIAEYFKKKSISKTIET